MGGTNIFGLNGLQGKEAPRGLRRTIVAQLGQASYQEKAQMEGAAGLKNECCSWMHEKKGVLNERRGECHTLQV
jgi:hypothetical protein